MASEMLKPRPMKKLLVVAVVGVALTYSGNWLRADDNDSQGQNNKKEKGVPPGLAKKGGLPPGQAKKIQAREAPAPNTPPTAAPAAPAPTTTAVTPPAPPATPTTPTPPAQPPPAPPKPATDVAIKADPTPNTPTTTTTATPAKPAVKVDKDVLERRAKLEKQVGELDAMGKQSAVKDRLAVRLYKRMDLPLSTVDTQQKANPDLGMGGITVANYIARWGKIPADQVFAEHKSGKGWGEIANAHKVSLHDLIDKMGEAKTAARDAEHDAAK